MVPLIKLDFMQKNTTNAKIECDEFNKLFDRYDLADEAFLKFQEAVNKERARTGFKKFALSRSGVDGYLGSRLHASQEFVGQKISKKLAERDLDSRQASDFAQAILSVFLRCFSHESRCSTKSIWTSYYKRI